MAAAVTVVVTRPGTAGRRLTDDLCAAGQPALWLPAFEFGPAPDEVAARRTLAELAGFELAIIVSPQAARATGALLAAPWPPTTAIAAVGSGTRTAVLASIAGAAAAPLIAPAGDEEGGGSGSEALWPMLRALPQTPRRVLLLRAQSGRDWLGERLQRAGAEVVPLAVYSRQPFAPSDALRAQLKDAACGAVAGVFSSSDAVDALTALLGAQPAVLGALRDGLALASHPRIAERLRAAGFLRIAECRADARSILAALREGWG